MSTGTLLSIDEYLASAYEPDCDFVDGRIEERNVGERTHARLQLRLGAYLLRYESLGVEFFTEMRVRVTPKRVRIPDICATLGNPREEVFTSPPFLCIEILSPEDRMSRVETRINDYLAMGVPHVWIIDPSTRQAYVAAPADGLREIKTGVLRTANPVLEVVLSEVLE